MSLTTKRETIACAVLIDKKINRKHTNNHSIITSTPKGCANKTSLFLIVLKIVVEGTFVIVRFGADLDEIVETFQLNNTTIKITFNGYDYCSTCILYYLQFNNG